MPPLTIIGVGWYSEDEWTMLKLLADDREALNPTYEQWRVGAEQKFLELKKTSGLRAVKVPVDVEVLRQWCRDHGCRLDAQARARFLAEAVKKIPYDEIES